MCHEAVGGGVNPLLEYRIGFASEKDINLKKLLKPPIKGLEVINNWWSCGGSNSSPKTRPQERLHA